MPACYAPSTVDRGRACMDASWTVQLAIDVGRQQRTECSLVACAVAEGVDSCATTISVAFLC